MNYRKLGETGLEVSEIGFGAWAIGGAGYGPTDDTESILTLHEALDCGINFIDTSDSYGKGHSEKLIGRVLAERKDKDTIVATKFGWDFYGSGGIRGNLNPEYIVFALDQSLARLKRDSIDIYQIHNQTPENILQFKVIETLVKLKEQGKIKNYGISVNYISDAVKLIKNFKFDTLQITYNLLFSPAEKELFHLKAVDSMGIICREPLVNGFLTGKYNMGTSFVKTDHRNGFNKNKKREIFNKVEQFRFLENNNRNLTQAAISYCLRNNAIGTTITGIKNRKQLRENIASTNIKISNDEMAQIKKIQTSWINSNKNIYLSS
ncbi:MAG: aldo/keto reductase [Thermodesulfobacteriota bacterium]